jgi:hypothetical protein
MKDTLTLVSLNREQIIKAKEENGYRKVITHVLICGSYGQIFGDKENCKKYYSVWAKIFPHIFDKAVIISNYTIIDFSTTFDLVNTLIEVNDSLERVKNPIWQEINKPKKVNQSFFSKFFK